MSTGKKVFLIAIAIAALALAWGYWHAQTHASLHLRVDDYGLKTANLAYGTPHQVTLELLGQEGELLATARSVEPLGYILAMHPQSDIGNCEHRSMQAAAAKGVPNDYPDCYVAYSRWSAQWAPRVRRANVVVAACEMRNLPVIIDSSHGDWWLWWVPLPHVGGVPRRHFEFAVKVDSRACTGVAG